jgi:hypothetical protein
MYISDYLPEHFHADIFGKKMRDYGEESQMQNRFEKTEDGRLIRIGSGRPVSAPEFRSSSSINIEKKPCGCMKS